VRRRVSDEPHQVAGWTKSGAGRSSHCTIRIATSIPVAYFAVRKPVSWFGLQPRSTARAGQVSPS
jgi:hypothetical protein